MKILENNLFKVLELINLDTFVVSDTHFGHSNITQFEPCRLEGMAVDGFDDHDEWVVYKWNSIVKPDDIVLHLGDFAFKNIQNVQHRLNGVKILILGNHDRPGDNTYTSFTHIVKGLYIEHKNNKTRHYSITDSFDKLFSAIIKEIEGVKILFSHYPVCESELRYSEGRPHHIMNERIPLLINLYNDYNCEINVHGHTHSNKMKDRDTRVFKNASLEHIGFMPIKLRELIKR